MDTNLPFRTAGAPRAGDVVGRQTEIEAVERALTFPGARLLVYGDRRTGKSSVLAAAQARLRSEKIPSVMVSFGGATTVADMATRTLRASTIQLRKIWKGFARDMTARLGSRAQLVPDPITGRDMPTLERGLRSEPDEAQRESLGAVLDALDAIAGERGKTFGVAIDDVEAAQDQVGVDLADDKQIVLGHVATTPTPA